MVRGIFAGFIVQAALAVSAPADKRWNCAAVWYVPSPFNKRCYRFWLLTDMFLGDSAVGKIGLGLDVALRAACALLRTHGTRSVSLGLRP